MREILISAGVCLGCLMLALVSQIVAPTPAQASSTIAPPPPEVRTGAALNPAAPPTELDPNDPNPRLFAMAPDQGELIAQGSAADLLGGEIIASKERITPSGLKITDLSIGSGTEAKTGDTVSVNYRGTLTNGREFDSSYRRNQVFTFPLGGGRVIRGWDEGVVGMKEGGKRKLVIPPDLAYGSRGAGGVGSRGKKTGGRKKGSKPLMKTMILEQPTEVTGKSPKGKGRMLMVVKAICTIRAKHAPAPVIAHVDIDGGRVKGANTTYKMRGDPKYFREIEQELARLALIHNSTQHVEKKQPESITYFVSLNKVWHLKKLVIL